MSCLTKAALGVGSKNSFLLKASTLCYLSSSQEAMIIGSSPIFFFFFNLCHQSGAFLYALSLLPVRSPSANSGKQVYGSGWAMALVLGALRQAHGVPEGTGACKHLCGVNLYTVGWEGYFFPKSSQHQASGSLQRVRSGRPSRSWESTQRSSSVPPAGLGWRGQRAGRGICPYSE